MVIIFAAAAMLAAWFDPDRPPVSGVATASDGDSFRLGAERIRLLGIDAPELPQTCGATGGGTWDCGRAARGRLEALLDGAVTCQPEDQDRFGRLLAYCEVAAGDLGALMVGEGLAIATDGYGAEQQAARLAGRGLWQGAFELPRAWRDRHPRAGVVAD